MTDPRGVWLRIGLVGCVKQKRTVAAPAADLYVSTLFTSRRKYVERTCERWFILSALHGLVEPEALLSPYDVTLVGASVSVKRDWSKQVVTDIQSNLDGIAGNTFEIHAGAEYRNFGLVDGLQRLGATVEIPAFGLQQGKQLQFYKARNE